jgi:hypothetical protein
MRSKGVSEHEIEGNIVKLKQVYKLGLTTITPSGKDKGSEPIYWSAQDPQEYNFSLARPDAKTDGVKQEDCTAEELRYTVASYFESRYGIKLRFPHWPIMCTKDGYFPVELLMQAKEKVFGENDQAKINAVLKFKDEFSAARRIQHIMEVLHRPLSQEYMPGLTSKRCSFLEVREGMHGCLVLESSH